MRAIGRVLGEVLTAGMLLAFLWVAYLAGVDAGVEAGMESAHFQRLQGVQQGYNVGLRDGARCMAHSNCFTISAELSQFAKPLRVKH